MSNLFINIRFLQWHFQLDRDWKPAITKNAWHKERNYEDGYFRVYKFFGFAAGERF